MDIAPTIEHVWIELSYKNKNSAILLGGCYQGNFKNKSNVEWLNELAQIKSKLDNTRFYAIFRLLKFDKDILEWYGLEQHIV